MNGLPDLDPIPIEVIRSETDIQPAQFLVSQFINIAELTNYVCAELGLFQSEHFDLWKVTHNFVSDCLDKTKLDVFDSV